MIVTIGPYFYTKLAKVSSRVESCLGLVLGKISVDCVEFCELLGLNFNTENPSLTKALKHAIDAQMAFYNHLIPLGIIFIGRKHNVPVDVVRDACIYFPSNRTTFAASYSPHEKEPLIITSDETCTIKLVGTSSDSVVIRTLFPEFSKNVTLDPLSLSSALPKELLSAIAMSLHA